MFGIQNKQMFHYFCFGIDLILISSVQIGTADVGIEPFEYISSWGSHGTSEGLFRSPSSLVVDSVGDVYVGDYNNHRV